MVTQMTRVQKLYRKGELISWKHLRTEVTQYIVNQRTNGPVNAHLISWPSKAQNIQNLEIYMVKK